MPRGLYKIFFIRLLRYLLSLGHVMTIKSYASPERLEQRIAPAGLVTLTFTNGVLTIDGADGADHDVSLVKTGAYSFRVDGNATDVGVLGQASKSFRGVLKGVVFEGGSGADTFDVGTLSPLKSFQFEGNAGVDTLTVTNLRTTLGGRVDIDLGAETGSVNLLGPTTSIHGPLNVNLGGGGTIALQSASTVIDGAVTVTGGLQADSVSISGASTVFRNKLTFMGGAGDDSFTSSGRVLTVLGLVSMDGEAGTDHFEFGSVRNTFGRTGVVGSMDLTLGEGVGSVQFSGQVTSILGDLKMNLGTGGGSAQLNSATTTIRDTVQVAGGVGNDSLGFNGRVSVGKSLAFLGNDGDDTLTAAGSLFMVRGATSMTGGDGASTFDLHPVALALSSLTVIGGVENDRVSIISDGTITGVTNVQLGLDGTGPSSVILQSQAGKVSGLKFSKTLTIDMIGATVDVLTIANIQVAQAFAAQTGEGVSTVDISRLNALGNFDLQTGAGADVVNLDNINARDFTVDTQVGADELRIERNALYTGQSRVLGLTTISTGIGADQIRIGNAIDSANLRVAFTGAVTLDAGDGANMRNDVAGSNAFQSLPVILSTGGTLTQTEAI